ncbi:MAG: siphovirus Gp157 family protein [Patescibacteria group bacterium]
MTTGLTLYEIGEDLVRLQMALEDPERDEEANDLITTYLADKTGPLAQKADGYAALIANLEALAAARKAEAKRLQERAQVPENQANRLRERMLQFMQKFDIQKIEAPRFTLTRCANGGLQGMEVEPFPPKEATDNPRFYPPVPTLDKKEVRKALEAGESLGWARLKERGEHLKIK